MANFTSTFLNGRRFLSATLLGKRFVSTVAAGTGASQTRLRREANGNVTVLSLASVYQPILTRQPNGNVTVGAA